MEYQASIITPGGERYEIHLGADDVNSLDGASARALIGEAFEAAGLETSNPVGKILLVDQILLLAREQKESRWSAPDTQTKLFLAAVLAALGRPTVTIDLANQRL